MNWLETNSTLLLPLVEQPAQPWLNTDARFSLNNHLPTVQNLSPLTAPIQVGTLSVSPLTSGIRADIPRTITMPPETRTAEFKRMEETIIAARQDSSQKYEMLMDTLKGQSTKLDQTIENQGAQISDIRSMIGTMAQQIEFTLLKLSHTSGESSHHTARHTSSSEGGEGRNKGLQDDRILSYKVHRPKHFFLFGWSGALLASELPAKFGQSEGVMGRLR